MHPPLLYLGYVGFSISFSFAIAALIEGRIDAAWARLVRPWTLLAWMFLTLGIAMGSYWAYYELGWGGWWFWDPVENASLMPWLAGTALLHSAVGDGKAQGAEGLDRSCWRSSTFSLSLVGTFLVRSGVLTSVHAFATDPTRGVFILAILVTFIGGALRCSPGARRCCKQGGLFAPVSREGALLLNNLFLTTRLRDGFCRHAVSAGAGGASTARRFPSARRFSISTFGPLFIPLADRGAVRAAAGLEARRSAAALRSGSWRVPRSALIGIAVVLRHGRRRSGVGAARRSGLRSM